MKVQLVSFPKYARMTLKRYSERLAATCKILNETDADFVMFSEHLFRDPEILKAIRKLVKNKSVTALIELNERNGYEGNRTYLLQDGEWSDMGGQVFSIPEEVAGGIECLIDAMCGEYECKRQFIVSGKKFLFIQCGENHILKGSSGIAKFRLQNRPDLESRFEELLNSVDIVLNPVHDRWGRFGHFLARLRKFSENGRYCFSNCQMVGNQLEAARKSPAHNTTHVAMHNSEQIAPISTEIVDAGNEKVLVQTFEVL